MAEASVQRILSSHLDGRAQGTRFKQQQLAKLFAALDTAREQLVSMLLEHTAHTRIEADLQITLSLRAVRAAYDSINFDKSLEDEYSIARGRDRPHRARAVGVVYIIPDEHTLVYTVIDALVAAVVAGNCVIIEIKQHDRIPHAFAGLLRATLDPDAFMIVKNGPADIDLLGSSLFVLDLKGRAAAPAPAAVTQLHTIPTVALVDRTGDVSLAAREIQRAQKAFAGSSPYRPSIVLVNDFTLEQFNSKLRATFPEDTCAKFTDYVVVVHDRKELNSVIERLQGDRLIVCTISSLEDGIDVLNEFDTLQATYLFAAPQQAKYLSQFLNARLTVVDHIPVELLLGPAPPLTIPPRIFPRFAPEDFSRIHPELIKVSKQSSALAKVLDASRTTKSEEVRSRMSKQLLREPPLQSIREPPGGGIGFFEQGIITGGSILLSTIIATGVATGLATKWYILPLLWS